MADRLLDIQERTWPVRGGRWSLRQKMPNGGRPSVHTGMDYERREDAEADAARSNAMQSGCFEVWDREVS